jgi:hypothetical protein
MYKYATETNSFLIRLVDLTLVYTDGQITDVNHVHPQLKKNTKNQNRKSTKKF